MRVPSPNWRDAWARADPTAREIPQRQVDWEKLYPTAVEVIDLATQRVIARTVIEEYIVDVLAAEEGGVVQRRCGWHSSHQADPAGANGRLGSRPGTRWRSLWDLAAALSSAAVAGSNCIGGQEFSCGHSRAIA